MTRPDDPSRREMFLKLGLLFTGFVSMLLGVPILGYVLSPVVRGRKAEYGSWVSLGSVDQFPPGETRLSTYRHPSISAWEKYPPFVFPVQPSAGIRRGGSAARSQGRMYPAAKNA